MQGELSGGHYDNPTVKLRKQLLPFLI